MNLYNKNNINKQRRIRYMDGNAIASTDLILKKKSKGISGSTIKLVAIITMLIDHIAAICLDNILIKRGLYTLDWSNPEAMNKFMAENGLLYNIDTIMRSIGRLAFPLFCFLLVEGFLHTRSKWKYSLRLAAFALISEVPFDLAFHAKPFFWGYQSVYFTLLIGLLVLIGLKLISDVMKDKKYNIVFAVIGAILAGDFAFRFIKFYKQTFLGLFTDRTISRPVSIILVIIFSVIMLIVYAIMCKKKSFQSASILFTDLAIVFGGMQLADLVRTDYGSYGVLTIAIIYILRRNKVNSILGGSIILTIMSYSEIPSLLDLILIRFYNGERGLKLKYVFYLFYPVHLFILYLICKLIKVI